MIVVRLAGLPRLLGEDRALALDDRRIELLGRQRQRIGRRHMHGDLARDGVGRIGLAGRLDSDQHAELAEIVGNRVVDIGRDSALLHAKPGRAAEAQVLADRADRILDRVGHRLVGARILRRRDVLGLAAEGQRHLGDIAHDLLEGLVAGDEIGFGVDLDHDGLAHTGIDRRSGLPPRCGRPSCRPWRYPSCAASRPPPPCRRWSRQGPPCNPSCPRRSARGAPSPVQPKSSSQSSLSK